MSRLRKNVKLAAVLVAAVAAFEGLRTVAYRDPVGIPTICFGETRGVRIGDRKTAAECRTLLQNRLYEFEAGVRSCLLYPDKLPDGTYAAILSFAYNVGTNAFCQSTLKRKLDKGDIKGACAELPRWVKAKGVRLPGLVNRREAERKLCLKETI